jgi:hypothetical protein
MVEVSVEYKKLPAFSNLFKQTPGDDPVECCIPAFFGLSGLF